MQQLRSATAAACSIGGRGRRATTAIALSLGPDYDPHVVAQGKRTLLGLTGGDTTAEFVP